MCDAMRSRKWRRVGEEARTTKGRAGQGRAAFYYRCHITVVFGRRRAGRVEERPRSTRVPRISRITNLGTSGIAGVIRHTYVSM